MQPFPTLPTPTCLSRAQRPACFVFVILIDGTFDRVQPIMDRASPATTPRLHVRGRATQVLYLFFAPRPANTKYRVTLAGQGAKISAQVPHAPIHTGCSPSLARNEEGQRGPLYFESLLAKLHYFAPAWGSNAGQHKGHRCAFDCVTDQMWFFSRTRPFFYAGWPPYLWRTFLEGLRL